MASPKLPSHRAKVFGTRVIGFTYGTFDLLHDGHIYFLRRARRRCDQLIVAIDSDRFARELKGPGRPVESAAVRSQALIASGLVRFVIEVDSVDQLFRAVDYYQPDAVFFGDDGRIREPADPRVVLVPLLPGHSTTAAIKERLQ
jgi:D-beta-D-heptose 7-phosphate kinase/D-beta-D-heptose 1-phosphate adenosyltransferase